MDEDTHARIHSMPLASQVFEEQVTKAHTGTRWTERKSTLAICDEIGMENIPVTKVGAKNPQKLMPKLPADAMLYGMTICARLGWLTDCFQVLRANKKNICSRHALSQDSRSIWFGCRSSFQLMTSRLWTKTRPTQNQALRKIGIHNCMRIQNRFRLFE